MAWQNEQFIHRIDNNVYFDGNVDISSIEHSGTNLRVRGNIQFVARGTSGWSGYFNAGVWAAAQGQGDAKILGNGEYLRVDSSKYREFDVTIGGVSESATSYNFNVRYHSEYFDVTLYWMIYFSASGTTPTGLSATFVSAGPDWADITVNLDSWGTPSGSVNRYIEAAVLGSSSYGDPYRYKTTTAVMTNTFHVDNTGSGNLTIVPNTQYHYGGYATNTVMSTRTVAGTFTTLPAVPAINAVDQGHGVIDVTITHANEGSAETVTEEYSIDGGATWSTITGGAFTLNLSSQTVLTVRRVSAAGESSDTVTVTPEFTTAIYASVMNKSVLIDKVYAPKASSSRQMVSINSVTNSEYATVPEENYATLKARIMANFNAKQAIAASPSWEYCDISLYHRSSGGPMYSLYFHLRPNPTPGSSPNDFALLVAIPPTGSFSDFVSSCANYGIVVDPSYENAPTDVDVYLPIDATFGYPNVSKKVAKIYASVEGKTKLVFEDPS